MFISKKGIEIIKIDENNMYPLLYHYNKFRNLYKTAVSLKPEILKRQSINKIKLCLFFINYS